MLRALSTRRVQVAMAGGIALSAYLATQTPIKALESDDHIFVINGALVAPYRLACLHLNLSLCPPCPAACMMASLRLRPAYER